ncbi:MAG: hypothetical protein N3C60_06970 [Calditerrivibrio sp.]|nr:hypothetical protein [Calditerrivibrio sp.]
MRIVFQLLGIFAIIVFIIFIIYKEKFSVEFKPYNNPKVKVDGIVINTSSGDYKLLI